MVTILGVFLYSVIDEVLRTPAKAKKVHAPPDMAIPTRSTRSRTKKATD